MLRTRPLSLHDEDLAGAGTTVARVWRSSLDQVTRGGSYGALAGDVLGVLAYFAAEDIPRFLLEAPAIAGEATLGGGDPLAVDLALVGLADYSLVSLEPHAISLHRLVQHLTREHVEDGGVSTDHIATAIRLLRAALGGQEVSRRVSRLLPHIAAVADHAARLSALPEEIASLLNVAAQDRLDSGQLDLAQSLLDRALAIATGSLGPDHPQTLLARNSRARSLGERGRTKEAIAGLQLVLEDRLRVLGPDHTATFWTRHNLARFQGEGGGIADAIAEFELLFADRLRVLGPDHPHTLSTRDGIARWLGESGKTEEAIAQLQALVEDKRRVFGPDHPAVLGTRNGLARFLGEAGRVTEAIARLQLVLQDRLRLFDADHPHTLWTRHNLALFLGRDGRVAEAIGRLEALLEDRLRVLGPDNPATLWNRHHLALFLGEQGGVQEAVARLDGLLDDCLRVLGPDHLLVARTRSGLARFSEDSTPRRSPTAPGP
jgi:tetratricopeptide (TPR) repeat protein